MTNNSKTLIELRIKKFKSMLETDFKNGDITKDEYDYFKYELQSNNLYYQYGLYIAYLIKK